MIEKFNANLLLQQLRYSKNATRNPIPKITVS